MEDLMRLKMPRGHEMPGYEHAKPMSKERKAFEAKYKGINRNETCPCGSGKKFKKCCLPMKPTT